MESRLTKLKPLEFKEFRNDSINKYNINFHMREKFKCRENKNEKE